MSVGLWIALALGVLNLAVWALVVVLAVSAWRKWKPTLAMFLGFPPEP